MHAYQIFQYGLQLYLGLFLPKIHLNGQKYVPFFIFTLFSCLWEMAGLEQCLYLNFPLGVPTDLQTQSILQGLNLLPFFVGSPDIFFVFFPLLFFSLLCSCFTLQHSQLPSCLCISDISLVIYVLNHSDHSAACSLPSQITTILT